MLLASIHRINKYVSLQFFSEINELKSKNLKKIFNDIDLLLIECNTELINKKRGETKRKYKTRQDKTRK